MSSNPALERTAPAGGNFALRAFLVAPVSAAQLYVRWLHEEWCFS